VSTQRASSRRAVQAGAQGSGATVALLFGARPDLRSLPRQPALGSMLVVIPPHAELSLG
jgi:hypothetical protein